jgi:hypothetical protein
MPYVAELINHIRARIYETAYLVPDRKPLNPSNCKGFSRSSCVEEVMVNAGNDGESAEIWAV